jgi:hypothetical protein
MIKTRHHWFLYPFFEWYSWFRMNRHFKSIHMVGTFSKTGLPVLIIANHFSWWDGFFIASLNRKIFQKKFHVMMLEDQLKKNWFFRYTGAFSIRKSSKDIIESLKYGIELLQNPNHLLTFFPQGKFESAHQSPLHFEKGLEWLLKNLQNEVHMVFVANQTEYFESAKPKLFMHFKTYDYNGKNLQKIERDYNAFYLSSSLKNTKTKES